MSKHSKSKHRVLGFISTSFSETAGLILPANALVPLTSQIFALNINIAPLGGLIIQKAGTYGITFNGNSSIPATFQIFAKDRLIASVSNLPESALTKVADITAYLAENEILYVKTADGITLSDANLTAARLH
ncbi:hypothetical protein IEO70_06685 [Bacillus sp. AGMB 02131]|uniref:Uncharacterized protein n=1 Tax=Peribacillus faecalis TaxID=2772559 RepID=A0A927CVR8_9BACI|nr:hypothetical protein [Peribacillus faecalis]MBD3108049.1 hypothetical protein [Peribacillus faecalis]